MVLTLLFNSKTLKNRVSFEENISTIVSLFVSRDVAEVYKYMMTVLTGCWIGSFTNEDRWNEDLSKEHLQTGASTSNPSPSPSFLYPKIDNVLTCNQSNGKEGQDWGKVWSSGASGFRICRWGRSGNKSSSVVQTSSLALRSVWCCDFCETHGIILKIVCLG